MMKAHVITTCRWYTCWLFTIVMENGTESGWFMMIYLLKVVILHSYDKLPGVSMDQQELPVVSQYRKAAKIARKSVHVDPFLKFRLWFWFHTNLSWAVQLRIRLWDSYICAVGYCLVGYLSTPVEIPVLRWVRSQLVADDAVAGKTKHQSRQIPAMGIWSEKCVCVCFFLHLQFLVVSISKSTAFYVFC